MCLPECQQQESRAVAVVSGLKFANIIHWPKLTVVGLASVPVKILKNQRVTVRGKLPLSLQPHCLFLPPFRLVLTHKPSWISIKLIPSECLNFAVMNSENTSIFETRVHNSPQCHPRSLILAKIESPLYLLIINNNLGGILPHFRDSARFLLKTALF